MTLDDVLTQLRSLGDPARRASNDRRGADPDQQQFGVRRGDLRKVAKPLKRNPGLARELWATGNIDARLLAILLLRPSDVDEAELDRMVRSVRFVDVADWLSNYIVKKHKAREALRERWMGDDDPWAARAGWSLTAVRVAEAPEALDAGALLDRIEAEMADAHEAPQWTMNNTLAAIGIHAPAHRERALAIGEALGVYRDYPVSKGCTSPFAPIWIGEMVHRQEQA